MIKFLNITRSAWIGFLIALVASFIMAATTYAQERSEDVASKYGVSFPVADLGGCEDYANCRNYCEDPLNAESCINYAKQKGFYKEESFEVNNKILETAKEALGCDSKTACLNFCEIPANQDKCDSFAKGQGLVGGRVDDPSKTQVITRAREVLGCDSKTGCQSLCSLEENRQKCSEFAKEVGLHGGEQKVGPGGCTSESTCKSFCSDPQNFQVCSGFTEIAGGKFKGPGGCDSEASCRTYCQSNEKECSQVFGGPGSQGEIKTKYDPVEMCNRTPNCAWTGNNCQCGYYGETKETAEKSGEYAVFCRANPEKCRSDQVRGGPLAARREFEDYCAKNPAKCRQPEGRPGEAGRPVFEFRDPATECSRYGCSWQGGSCQCAGIKDYDPAAQCGRSPNCKWEGNHCQCSSDGYRGDPKEDARKAEEYAKFCRENPQKCGGSGQPGGPGDGDDPRYYSPRPASTSYPNPYPYPQQTSYPQQPDSPRGPYPQASYNPQASYQPVPRYQPPSGYQPPSDYQAPQPQQQVQPQTQPQQAPQQQPQQQEQQPAPQPQQQQTAPAPQQEAPRPAEQQSAPAPAPANPAPPPPAGVQGASTVRNIWGQVVDLFR